MVDLCIRLCTAPKCYWKMCQAFSNNACGCYWHLVGRVQGHEIACNVWGNPAQGRTVQLQMPSMSPLRNAINPGPAAAYEAHLPLKPMTEALVACLWAWPGQRWSRQFLQVGSADTLRLVPGQLGFPQASVTLPHYLELSSGYRDAEDPHTRAPGQRLKMPGGWCLAQPTIAETPLFWHETWSKNQPKLPPAPAQPLSPGDATQSKGLV